jgi:hypothetical protein
VCLLCSVTNFANFPLVLHTGFGGYMNTLSLSAVLLLYVASEKKETAICRLAYKNKKVLLFLYVDAPVTGDS